MNYWDDFDQSGTQAHWSAWVARPKERVRINNYLSALIFALSAFVVATQFGGLV